ncbi:hypothetical protein BDV26DRAFT_286588 [Aspergillus bertholletiae]|uniref:BTB domain-containing protein n=1 Tax=Aspergillus bertholletiae TaxID=1226010 RepID=A0A5N7AS26_9EURO|nr:hypothetical protein BDV26DRAFT_286588 [Aspergillus bertholletiae]
MPDDSSSQADGAFDLERIDPEGNVILLVEGQSTARFLVSSKILSMASQVFAKLFNSKFSEGIQMTHSTCPTISIHGDDTAAMRTIIRILHYQDPPQDNPINAESFAIIAIHCDKYDCIKALRPWTFKWFSDLQSIATAEEYGYLLLAAHLFRSAEQFSRISVKAQTRLSSKFLLEWAAVDILNYLPNHVENELVNRIEKLLCHIHTELQSVENYLRNDQWGYIMDGKVCMNCGRTLPDTAKRCRPCSSSDLRVKYCTGDSRIADYFAVLRKSRLWPSMEYFHSCSATEITLRISQTKAALRHSCQAVSCPLELELDELVRNVNGIIGKVKGLELYPL